MLKHTDPKPIAQQLVLLYFSYARLSSQEPYPVAGNDAKLQAGNGPESNQSTSNNNLFSNSFPSLHFLVSLSLLLTQNRCQQVSPVSFLVLHFQWNQLPFIYPAPQVMAPDFGWQLQSSLWCTLSILNVYSPPSVICGMGQCGLVERELDGYPTLP